MTHLTRRGLLATGAALLATPLIARRSLASSGAVNVFAWGDYFQRLEAALRAQRYEALSTQELWDGVFLICRADRHGGGETATVQIALREDNITRKFGLAAGPDWKITLKRQGVRS